MHEPAAQVELIQIEGEDPRTALLDVAVKVVG
jgi:hypothetical protein